MSPDDDLQDAPAPRRGDFSDLDPYETAKVLKGIAARFKMSDGSPALEIFTLITKEEGRHIAFAATMADQYAIQQEARAMGAAEGKPRSRTKR